MNDGQTAYSKELNQRVIKLEYGIYYYDNNIPSEALPVLDCNMNYLLTDDWEIDLPFVDFWTAYQAARDEGLEILWEGAEYPYVYDNLRYISLEMLNGRWQIFK